MSRQRETNPHFLPRHNDPEIEFPTRTPHTRTRVEPPYGPRHNDPVIEFPTRTPHTRTRVEPPYGPRHQPPSQSRPPLQVAAPSPQPLQDSKPQATPDQDSHPLRTGHHPTQNGDVGRHHRHQPAFLRAPASQQTRPIAWLVAALCALFWLIIIVGGLIILIVYLAFRPRSPRFDISTASFNAAYLDLGYLLTADVALLANFSNPNTKVKVDFSYVVFDLYYDNNFIATRYVEPFSVPRRGSRFANVHMVASQVRLSVGQIMELQRNIERGIVNFEVRGLFKTRSRLGGFLQYTYRLNAHCQIALTGPPTGVLIGKRCVTRR